MTFKMKPGDVCKLTQVIPGIYKSDAWKTGLYRVVAIRNIFGRPGEKYDPRSQSYQFEKIKKDGTVYKNFANGYNCIAWDKMIEDKKVEIICLT